jgi:hypothetical protein
MSDARQERLSAFVAWVRAHVTGDEKGEAHIFVDHLFHAFGQRGSLDVGGSPECRIRKAAEGGGAAFADNAWKPVVLIEMKKRGVDLGQHFRQAFDYWVRLVPDRPQYAVLCNFDEFWIYDFNVQIAPDSQWSCFIACECVRACACCRQTNIPLPWRWTGGVS